MLRRIKYLVMTALLLPWACVTYTSSLGQVRLELPAISEGERVVTYSGYDDVSYGPSAVVWSEPDKVGYTVSYDMGRKIPRWVAYDLTAEETMGTASRDGMSFHVDESAGFRQAEYRDYRGSGWTKGHLAPAADFKWSRKALDDTFCFTNCCPQDETLNGTYWERLERRVRQWAQTFGVVYVVTGPMVAENEYGTIGPGRVTVPDAFFKAVLAKDGESFQSVAFVMMNSSVKQPYPECCMSVNDLEELLGMDLFCGLGDKVEEAVEDTVDRRFWGF